jgi:inward rectifier potassium channel
MQHNSYRQRPGSIDNTGFGTNSGNEGGRLVNRNGSINLVKTGIPFLQRMSLYHSMLRMPRAKFLLMVFLFYTIVNVFFAILYMVIGVENLEGGVVQHTLWQRYLQAFFFSSQTLTTVGYGHISPTGIAANILASLESFIGIIAFALVTGMFYARFSRPRAYLVFSDHLLVSPYKEGKALMFRVATFKNNHLTDAEAQVTAAFHVLEEGRHMTRFYQLPLEIARINSLAMSWTLVHNINDQSPFWGYTEADFNNANIELMVTIRAFDDHYANLVQQRTSYATRELVYGARFKPAYHRSEDGTHTVLELDKISAYEPVQIKEPVS